MKTISVVLPTYNEEENVVPIHNAIVEIFKTKLPNYNYEILFIDNKSQDRTRDRIRGICYKDSHTKAIFNAQNFGFLNSPYYGLLNASGDCAILMASDFQEPVELIPQMVQEWENGNKVVCCVKTSTSAESGLMYSIRSLYYHTLKKMSSGVEQIEHFTGFGLYDRDFLETLRSLNDPMPFLRGIVAEFSPDRKLITYRQAKRRSGKTKFNLYRLYELAMISFTSYTKVGLRLASIGGFFLAALSLLASAVFFVLRIAFPDMFPEGNVALTLFILVFGAIQVFFIGLVGEYILSINTRIINRPLVVEEERVGFPRRESRPETGVTAHVDLKLDS